MPRSKKPKLVTHRELAKHLGVHPDSVHRWVEKGTGIPHVREHYGISGRSRIRFNVADVLQWQASRNQNFDSGGSEAKPS